LRFVPYIGAIASAVFPLIVATAVEPGWTMTLLTVALFLIVELLIGQVLEPLAYGHSSGLSPVAVVASATFWTWLWGPIGLILATPLTVCLVVAGRHVERLRFMEILLGDQPALSPAQITYQRLLAADPVEAVEQGQRYLSERPLADYYQEVLLGGLRLAWSDAQRGVLDEEQLRRIRDTDAELIEEFESHEEARKAQPEPPDEGPLATLSAIEERGLPADKGTPVPSDRKVHCIAGHGMLDEATAMALAQLLRRQGVAAASMEAEALSMAKLFSLPTQGVAVICLCYLERATPAQVRYAARRLRRKAPEAFIAIALLGEPAETGDDAPTQLPERTELVRGSLEALASRVHTIVITAAQPPAPLARAG